MLNILLHSVDAVARDVLAIGTDYTPGTLLPTHSHRRAQFLYGMSGLMEVETDDGAWTIPPYSGVWIPASKPHSVRMQGVSTRSLYAGFRDFVGASPMQYLRELRLERARAELLGSDAANVAAVALRWGFAHLGRFSSEYRQRFGETPSETLKRR